MIWLKLDSCRDWVLSIVLKLHVQVSVCVHGGSGPSSCFLRFMFVFLRWFSQMELAVKGPWRCFFPATCCQGRDCGVSVRLDGGRLKNSLTSFRSDSADTWPTFRFASWFTQLKVRVVFYVCSTPDSFMLSGVTSPHTVHDTFVLWHIIFLLFEYFLHHWKPFNVIG